MLKGPLRPEEAELLEQWLRAEPNLGRTEASRRLGRGDDSKAVRAFLKRQKRTLNSPVAGELVHKPAGVIDANHAMDALLGRSPRRTYSEPLGDGCECGDCDCGGEAEPEEPPFKFEVTGESATLESPESGRIKTLEELLAVSEVDLSEWEVEKHTVNAWEGFSKLQGVVTLHQVKAHLKRRTAIIELRALKAELLEEVRGYAPQYREIHRAAPPKTLMVLGIFDPHLGRLAWAPETGARWDLETSVEQVRSAAESLLAKAQAEGVERIVFPIGNDLMHVDSPANATSRGTPQDVDGRYRQIKRAARHLVRDVIEMAREVAPVTGISVPGNHGHESDLDIAEWAQAWFHNAKDIQVDISYRRRHYLDYGVNLLGFTHGDGQKPDSLPSLMPLEASEQWGRTSHREFLIGHFHKKNETVFQPLTEHGGVRVRVVSSLAPNDAWHEWKGYGAIRAAESFYYSAADGYVGERSVAPQL